MPERKELQSYLPLMEKKKKKKKKKKSRSSSKSRYRGTTAGMGWGMDSGGSAGGDGGGGGMGESLIVELFGMRSGALPGAVGANMLSIVRASTENQKEEEEESAAFKPAMGNAAKPTIGGIAPNMGTKTDKIDIARGMLMPLHNKGLGRHEIIDEFTTKLGLTPKTATSYYERLAKEMGLTGRGDGGDDDSQMLPPGSEDMDVDMGQTGFAPGPLDIPDAEEFQIKGDKNRQGILRRVPGAHLVYKRMNEEGTYDELWIYNTTDKIQDELTIKRAILAGSDIPSGTTKSKDGRQKISLSTMGNAQLLHITGMPS